MDSSADPYLGTISTVSEFALQVAADREKTYDTLLHRGRRVTEVEARILEAQFRLPDGRTLLLLNEDQPFKEKLTLLLLDAGLRVLDRIEVGGAFTPGYLTYAYPVGPDAVAFCWHDLDQLVTVRRFVRWFGLRSSWLRVRDVAVQQPRPADRPTHQPASRARRARRRSRAVPSLVWLAWLSLRTFRFGRAVAARDRGPRR